MRNILRNSDTASACWTRLDATGGLDRIVINRLDYSLTGLGWIGLNLVVLLFPIQNQLKLWEAT
jgi:hypothetical protein